MQKITPMLWFNNNVEEALNYYTSIFKDAVVGKITRYPAGSPVPEGTVMTGELLLFGQQFILLNGGPHFKFNEAISMVINCLDQAEIDFYWEKLTANGGEESMCGWLKDRFGMSWQVTPSDWGEIWANPATAPAVMKEMMTMKKIDMIKLKAVAAG